VVKISCFSAIAPALPYYRPSMDIRVAEIRNSPAHYTFMACDPRLEPEYLKRQSVRPRLNQRFLRKYGMGTHTYYCL